MKPKFPSIIGLSYYSSMDKSTRIRCHNFCINPHNKPNICLYFDIKAYAYPHEFLNFLTWYEHPIK